MCKIEGFNYWSERLDKIIQYFYFVIKYHLCHINVEESFDQEKFYFRISLFFFYLKGYTRRHKMSIFFEVRSTSSLLFTPDVSDVRLGKHDYSTHWNCLGTST